MADATTAINIEEKISIYAMFHEFVAHTGENFHQGIGVGVGSDGKLIRASASGVTATLGRCEDELLAAPAGSTVKVRSGIIGPYANDAGHLLAIASRFQPCYWTDDQTLGTDATKNFAGLLYDVDSRGVWVIAGPMNPVSAAAGTVIATNNLSDVANANTARHNLGADKVYLSLSLPDLVGADAKVYRIASPVAGTITNIRSSLQGATLTTGNAVLTGKIASTGITGGALTLVQSGSALGDSVSVTPSAANTVVAGSDINFTVSGTQASASAQATLTIEITLPGT